MKTLYLIFAILFFCSVDGLKISRASNINGKIIDRANENINLKFYIALKPQNIKALEAIVLEVSNPDSYYYGNYLNKNDIIELIKPKSKDIYDVSKWLNYNNIKYEFVGDAFICNAKIKHINKLFNIDILEIKKNGKTWYGIYNNYNIPTNLQNQIDLIGGLSLNMMKIQKTKQIVDKNNNYPDPGFVSREVIQRLYDLGDATIKNRNVSVCAVEFNGYGYNETNLEISQTENGIPARKIYKSIGINPGSGTETVLDLDMIADTASGVELWYMNFENTWIYEMGLDIFNMNERPMILSLSYGWAEWDQCSIILCGNKTSEDYIERANVELLKLAALGITTIVADGDAGSPGRTNEGCSTYAKYKISPVFPGSSPWITSVGATFVVSDGAIRNFSTPICAEFNCATGTQQKPANYYYTQWTTGGGFSNDTNNNLPWQKQFIFEYLSSGVSLPPDSYWNINGRGYPDVVANGHNCPVYGLYGDGFQVVDGTSCSCPIFAAIVALLNDHQLSNGKNVLGFINPLLYKIKSDYPNAFGKTLKGNNHCTEATCCSADYGFITPMKETKWNPVSGLGFPVVSEIKKYLDSL